MSKIQEFFSAGGRRLFDSEKPVVDAFNDKYGRALAGAAVPQHRAERANPQPDQNRRTSAERVLVSGRYASEQTRVLASTVLTQQQASLNARRLAASVLSSNDKEARGPQSVGAKARTIRRQNIAAMVTKKLGAPKSR